MNKKRKVVNYIAHDDERLDNRRFISWLERTTTGHNAVTAHTLPNKIELILNHTKLTTIRGNEHIFTGYINKKFAEFEHVCMKDDELSWINQNDPRLCYFCWGILSRIRDCNGDFQTIDTTYSALNESFIAPSTLIKPRQTVLPKSPNTFFYHEVNQPTKPINAKEIVIFYIDALKLSREQKDRLLGCMRNLYLDVLKEDPFKVWLVNTDQEQLIWVEQYLKNKLGFVNRLVGKDLLLRDIQSYLDVLYLIDEPTWKLNIAQMKKAWSQKKLRHSGRDKKQYNFNMKNDISDLLDILCNHEKISKGDLIEALIREKYYHFSSIEKASL